MELSRDARAKELNNQGGTGGVHQGRGSTFGVCVGRPAPVRLLSRGACASGDLRGLRQWRPALVEACAGDLPPPECCVSCGGCGTSNPCRQEEALMRREELRGKRFAIGTWECGWWGLSRCCSRLVTGCVR